MKMGNFLDDISAEVKPFRKIKLKFGIFKRIRMANSYEEIVYNGTSKLLQVTSRQTGFSKLTNSRLYNYTSFNEFAMKSRIVDIRLDDLVSFVAYNNGKILSDNIYGKSFSEAHKSSRLRIWGYHMITRYRLNKLRKYKCRR